MQSITYLQTNHLHPNSYNPRKHKDSQHINELAESIKNQGIIEPLVVRESKQFVDAYEIVCGERRFKGATLAGIPSVPCIIRELTDEEALKICIIENLQRRDIHPMDEARGYHELQTLSGASIEDIAQSMGVSGSLVAHRLKLLDLIPELKDLMDNDILGLVQAMELARYSPVVQLAIYESIYSEHNKSWFTAPTLKALKNRISENILRDLTSAGWDLHDENLIPGPGACSTCQFNTASQYLLFPDEKTAGRCMNSDCYEKKSTRGLLLAIEEIQSQQMLPIPVVFRDWGYSTLLNSKKQLLQEHTKYAVSNFNDWNHSSLLYKPEKPDEVDMTQFDEIEDPDEKMDARTEAMVDYQNEMQEYETDMAEFEAAAFDESYHKVIFIDDDLMPEIGYAKLKSNSGSTDSSIPEAALLSQEAREIKVQIEKAEKNASRATQLAFEKTYAEVSHLVPIKEYAHDSSELGFPEKVAMTVAMFNEVKYEDEIIEGFYKRRWNSDPFSDYQIILNFTPEQHTIIWRTWLRKRLRVNLDTTNNYPEAKALIEVFRSFKPVEVMEIEQRIQPIYEKKAEVAKAKVKKLKADLKVAIDSGSGEEE